MTLDRKAIAAAIFDPGATEGLKGDRTLTEWQTDAVMRLLSTAPSGQAPLEGVKPLEWKKNAPDSQLSYAETIFGTIYRVWTHHEANGEWFWNGDGDCHTVQSEVDGKAAAQADYEARIRSALLPASAEPVALWQCELEDGRIEHFAGMFGKVLSSNGVSVVKHTPLYLHPPASGAVEAGWRIERMLEIIAEAFGLVQALDKRHGPNEIARCQSNLISVLSYEDWTIPADFDELKRLLNLPAAPTEGR